MECLVLLHQPALLVTILEKFFHKFDLSVPSAKDFISHLMEKNPEKRFTCDQALQHPW